jgi:hypothetical protein
VLEYRPCGRAFDCDTCPLYRALQGGGSGPEAPAAAVTRSASRSDPAVELYLAELGSGCTLRLDRAYGDDGLWIEGAPPGGAELRLGLDELSLRLLQPVDGVVLPRVGTWLLRGATCAWLNRGRLAIPLHCPIDCEVTALHPRPATQPARSSRAGRKAGVGVGVGVGGGRDGGGAEPGWWLQVKAHQPLAEAEVHRHEALLAWYLHRFQAVREHLDAVMAQGAEAGAGMAGAGRTALADGGRPEPNLEVVLGRERFEALVGSLFPMRG